MLHNPFFVLLLFMCKHTLGTAEKKKRRIFILAYITILACIIIKQCVSLQMKTGLKVFFVIMITDLSHQKTLQSWLLWNSHHELKAWFKRRILHAPNQILILVDSN